MMGTAMVAMAIITISLCASVVVSTLRHKRIPTSTTAIVMVSLTTLSIIVMCNMPDHDNKIDMAPGNMSSPK